MAKQQATQEAVVHTSFKAMAADGLVKKTDLFKASPQDMVEDPNFNLRDYSDPEVQAQIEMFAKMYEQGEYVPPLICRVMDGKVTPVEGHCRRRGALRRARLSLLGGNCVLRSRMVPVGVGSRGEIVEAAHPVPDAAGIDPATQGYQRHMYTHRTRSIDYAIVMSGEIDMLLDDSEIHLKAGDVLVQQGTNHAWVNRGSEPCRIAFVLIDAKEP